VFDDAKPWGDKLMLYGHRVDYGSGRPQAVAAEGGRIAVEQREPLRDECAHFLDCIANGSQPRTGATEALKVLAVLEAASHAARNTTRISISERSS
jgi:UDP-2-acetamido-3-amino-2,3-dideoxy-glucuronate N-acetyltransferase